VAPICFPCNTYFFQPTRVHNQNDISIGTAFFCIARDRVSSRMPGHLLSNENWPFAWGSAPPVKYCFLGPTRVQSPNGISIGSAIFAQLMSECCQACQGIPFLLRIARNLGGSRPHLIYGSLGPPNLACQTASQSVQPFLHS